MQIQANLVAIKQEFYPMNDLIKYVLSSSDIGIWPSLALVIFFGVTILILAWTYRPKAKNDYKKHAERALD